MTLRTAVTRFSWLFVCLLPAALVDVAAFPSIQSKTVAPVAPAALQKLLPTIDGWTSGVARSDLVDISPENKYSFASTTLTKDASRVKLTLADTGFSPDSLAALATMVVSMPEDYSGTVGGMAIKRSMIGGSPGVEAWDAQKTAGEVTVVVANRFVATAESTKIDSIATLRGIIDKIDLKALAEVK